MVLIGIYQITSPTGKVYIGQSNDIDKRFNTYRKLKRNRIGTALYNSFVKHGVENHKFSIIMVLSEKSNRQMLDHYEKLFIATNKKHGYSLLNMTDGGCGSWGYKHSKEVVEKLRILGTGENSGMSKPVNQYDLDGNYLNTYCTIALAAKTVGVSAPSVSAALRGFTYKAGGFKWKYKTK